MKNSEPTRHDLLSQLTKGNIGVDAVVAHVMRRPEAVDEVLACLSASQARIKYAAAKALRLGSEIYPAIVYPRLDRFIELLDSENSILKWNAIMIMANLAGVDSENRIEGILPRYFAPILGPVMITAANIIRSAHKFVAARPRLADFVAGELLKVEQACYKTRECRNVALGHAIEAFDRFFEHIRENAQVIEMVKRQLKNARSATRKNAAQFLKKHGALAPAKKTSPHRHTSRQK